MKQSTTKSSHQQLEKFTFPSNNLDYELIDCGNQRKLERFGSLILDRPEIEAKWPTAKEKHIWQSADWYFFEEKGKKGVWKSSNNSKDNWKISYRDKIEFQLQLTNFKHIGLFPEQAANWDFIEEQLQKINGPTKVLNLFAYTGAASIVAAKSGAVVTNVDSVKQLLNWGRKNAAHNEIDNIRWILEDAAKFVAKAVRRGDQYNGVIMDPPAFGYGAKKERWKLEKDLEPLLKNVCQLLVPNNSFFILNTYSPRMKMSDLKAILQQTPLVPNNFEASTLAVQTKEMLNLPLGNLIRWSNL